MTGLFKTIFNPFALYPAAKLILLGAFTTLFGSWIAFYFHARFDGVFDLHFVKDIQLWQPFIDNAINILCLFVVLGGTAKALNSKSRWIDMLAVVLNARLPYFLPVFFNIKGAMISATETLLPNMAQNPGNLQNFGGGALFLILLFAFFSLLMLFWYVTLLYNGFKLSAHAKGARPVIFFILDLIVCEVLSKFLIPLLT